MYRVRLVRRAARYYERVNTAMARRLERCFEDLSNNPFKAGNVRLMRGQAGLYRYRVGSLRVLFVVDGRDRIVTILAIGPRGDIY